MIPNSVIARTIEQKKKIIRELRADRKKRAGGDVGIIDQVIQAEEQALAELKRIYGID